MNILIIKELRITKNIPFIPDRNQIIYVENNYNSTLNNLIQRSLEAINSLFKKKNKTFVYIPNVVKEIQDNSFYYTPFLTDLTQDNSISSSDISNQIFSYSIEDIELNSGLVRYKEERENYYIFSYYTFDEILNEDELLRYIKSYISLLQPDLMLLPSPYYPYIENPDDNADYDFDTESKKLIEEIKERVEALKQKGITELVLKSILSTNFVKLSRLVITNEYKIFLPDYNNLEITMYPLPKAIFFLFLNYPEGILFKNLPDYRDELIAIYKNISGRENIDDMEKSINDVVNPTLNSINEKCSRIREAFIKHFDESIAKNYFITGYRATPKKIILDRKLVVLEDVNIKFNVVKTPFQYKKHEHPNNEYSMENPKFDDNLPY